MSTREDWIAAHPHLKEFFPYLDLLPEESERGKVLISTGYIEEQLKQILLAFMVKGKQANELVDRTIAPLGTLSSRISACYVLGLISRDEHDDLRLIAAIRNDFAHRIHTSFKNDSVADRCRALKLKSIDYIGPESQPTVGSPQSMFLIAAGTLILRLSTRPRNVAKQRRTSEDWPL